MFYKEEQILLPMCLDAFTEDDWADIWASRPLRLVPGGAARGIPPAGRPLSCRGPSPGRGHHAPHRNLSLQQLTAIFSTLPVDLTFVDADDRVRFFSEGPDRMFARSKAIVGRKVQHCHPPRSVSVVDRILSELPGGPAERRRNSRSTSPAVSVHIRYFAVRDAQSNYLGTLEVTQDLTRLRGLTGERRLLEYGATALVAAI